MAGFPSTNYACVVELRFGLLLYPFINSCRDKVIYGWLQSVNILNKKIHFKETLTNKKHLVNDWGILSHHQQQTKNKEDNEMYFEVLYSLFYLLSNLF